MAREFKCDGMSGKCVIIIVFYKVFQYDKKEMTCEFKFHGMSRSCIIIILFYNVIQYVKKEL